MPIVVVGDEQDDRPVEIERWLKLADDVLTAERVGEDVEVNVIYVNERTMAELNERFLGKSGPTDVLSFPIDEGPADSGRVPDNGGVGPGSMSPTDTETVSMLGDVVICPLVAEHNAPSHAGTYVDELALLLVHGILHLLGMDHSDDDEAAVMEARERELLEQFYKTIPSSAWEQRGPAPETEPGEEAPR